MVFGARSRDSDVIRTPVMGKSQITDGPLFTLEYMCTSVRGARQTAGGACEVKGGTEN